MTAEFSRPVRNAVYVRASYGCERDGRTDGLQVHHRRPRGMGGTVDPVASGPANALLLCHICHLWVETNRSAATANGWLVRSGFDPAEVPVRTYEGGWVLLTTDGTYGRLSVQKVIEIMGRTA